MEAITQTFLDAGTLGAAVLVLGIVILRLFNKLQAVQEERRLSDVKMIQELTAIIKDNTASNNLVAEKIEMGKRS